jgi:hypothetical protein
MKVGPFTSEQAFADHLAELVADRKRAFFAVADPEDSARLAVPDGGKARASRR